MAKLKMQPVAWKGQVYDVELDTDGQHEVFTAKMTFSPEAIQTYISRVKPGSAAWKGAVRKAYDRAGFIR